MHHSSDTPSPVGGGKDMVRGKVSQMHMESDCDGMISDATGDYLPDEDVL